MTASTKAPKRDQELAFDALVASFMGEPGVELPRPSRRALGSNALKVNGRIFAMLARGSLVLKLPAVRVGELLRSGVGAAFDAGKGKPMKEWLTLGGSRPLWLALAREAYAFVKERKSRGLVDIVGVDVDRR